MTRWRISGATAFVVSDPARVVVFNLDRPATQPLALLGTGATIWSALAGEADDARPWCEEQDLLAALADAYGVPASGIRDDVTAFLDQMAAGGYIERDAG